MWRRILLVLTVLGTIGATLGGIVLWQYVRLWDADVSERFRTHRWSFPSKIYSDSLLIYPGMDLAAIGFVDRLRELGYQQVQGTLARKGEYATDSRTSLDINLHDHPGGGESSAKQ